MIPKGWTASKVLNKEGDRQNWRTNIKGTVAWDFLSEVISPKVPNWSSDSWSKAVSNIDWNLPRNSTSKVSRAMGHCGEFFYVLWATTVNLVVRYGPLVDLVLRNGPLRRIWLCAMRHCAECSRTVKICIDFCAMGHSAGCGYALLAIAQGLVIRYGP